MNNFSFKRLGQYAKAEMCCNRKMIYLLMSSALAYFMIVFYINYLATNSDALVGSMRSIDIPIGFSWAAIVIFTGVFISTSFRNYFNKGYNSAAIMLPVSQAEKFVFSLVLYTFVVPITLIIIGYLASLGWSTAYGLDNPFFIIINSNGTGLTVVSSISSLSCFFFGGVFFRRNQFLLTMLCSVIFALSIAYIIYLLNLAGVDFEGLVYWFTGLFSKYDPETILEIMQYISAGFNLIVIAMFWTLSWMRFRKLQITK